MFPSSTRTQLIERKILEHERQTLLDKIAYAVESFDRAVARLRREKFKLDADLKTTDLKARGCALHCLSPLRFLR